MSTAPWKRLVRFHPSSNPSQILVGQPPDDNLDVGLAVREGRDVHVDVFEGVSVLDPGRATGRHETVGKLLAPVSQAEAGTVRCIGLNYRNHAHEAKMEIPTLPTLFNKPATAITNPYPTSTIPLPRQTLESDTGDYESELAVIIGRPCKNVSEADALQYVAGYTAANDISCRVAQFAQSQWCYSKSFDGACPIGPTLVSPTLIPNPSALRVRGISHTGQTLQDGTTDDLIFSVARIISFLSQDTTLPPGTVIITGTPAGVGFAREPKYTLRRGEEFRVEITPWIGTLCCAFE